jgi:hypothetical protein
MSTITRAARQAVPAATPAPAQTGQAGLGYDNLVDGKGPQAGLGSASLLLYFGARFTIQRLMPQARAQRIATVSPNTGARTTSW